MSDSIQASVNPAEIAEILRKAGYRALVVEGSRPPQVQSATQGVAFIVNCGNAMPDQPGRFIDFSLHCPIGLKGQLPQERVESWNQSKRFARVCRNGGNLLLSMDVMVAGGVTESFLHGQFELWDHVIRDFVRHFSQKATAKPAAAVASVAKER
jgi:hypothetical protein